jgi:hypothetical protein
VNPAQEPDDDQIDEVHTSLIGRSRAELERSLKQRLPPPSTAIGAWRARGRGPAQRSPPPGAAKRQPAAISRLL